MNKTPIAAMALLGALALAACQGPEAQQAQRDAKVAAEQTGEAAKEVADQAAQTGREVAADARDAAHHAAHSEAVQDASA
ncbi:hypothetical protein, partial [Xanthomonas translucens]